MPLRIGFGELFRYPFRNLGLLAYGEALLSIVTHYLFFRNINLIRILFLLFASYLLMSLTFFDNALRSRQQVLLWRHLFRLNRLLILKCAIPSLVCQKLALASAAVNIIILLVGVSC